MRKVAILSLFDPLDRVVGGVERFVFYLSRILRANEYDVDIITLETVGFKRRRGWLGFPLSSAVKALGDFFNPVSDRYDAVICNGPAGAYVRHGRKIVRQPGTYAGYAEAVDRKLLRIPYYFVRRYVRGRLEKKACSAGLVVAVSEHTRLSVRKAYRRPVHRVIGNGIDTGHFRRRGTEESRGRLGLPSDRTLALFVGRWEYGKGVDIIKRMLPRLRKRGIAVVCATDREVSCRGALSLVNVAYEDMPYVYSACDFFLFPTRFEGFGFAAMEAMACELPFVMARTGHAVEVANADPLLARYILPGASAKLYLEAVDSLLSETEDSLREIRRRGRRYVVENSSLEKFGRNYLDLLDEIACFGTA